MKGIIIFMAALGVALVMNFGVYHELAHQQIYKSFGCNSIITTNGIVMQTIPEINCTPNIEMVKLHMYNEIFGYHMSAFYGMFVVFFSLGFIYLIKVSEQKDRKTKRILEELPDILLPTEVNNEQNLIQPSQDEPVETDSTKD